MATNQFGIVGFFVSILGAFIFVPLWNPCWIAESTEGETFFKNASLTKVCLNFGELKNMTVNNTEYRFAKLVGFDITISANGKVTVHMPPEWYDNNNNNCVNMATHSHYNHTFVYAEWVANGFDFELNYAYWSCGTFTYALSLVLLVVLQFKFCFRMPFFDLLQLLHYVLLLTSTLAIDFVVLGFIQHTVAPDRLFKPVAVNAQYTDSFAFAYYSSWILLVAAILFTIHYCITANEYFALEHSRNGK